MKPLLQAENRICVIFMLSIERHPEMDKEAHDFQDYFQGF